MSEDLKELKEKTRKTAELFFKGLPREEGGGGAFEVWSSFDKELAKDLSLFFTGKLYAREKIPHRVRELVTVSALTVLNRTEELKAHLYAALNVGCTPQEIAEVIFQMTTYGGIPVINTALKTLRTVLQERGQWPLK